MALVLSMRVNEDVFVDKERFVLHSIVSDREFVLRRAPDGKLFTLKAGQSYEIAPNVRVSVGSRGQNFLARVVFEAPRSIKVYRGDVL